MGRERDGIKPEAFKAKILLWKIYEDDRPLYVEDCIVWVQFINLDGKQIQRLAHLFRHGRGLKADDPWYLESRVTDVVYSDHADFNRAPTNEDVYRFLKATSWHLDAEDRFVTLDAQVCSTAWKEVTGEAPTQFFSQTQPVLWAKGELESAPHGGGNIYAPDILIENDTYRHVVWRSRARDGHDRILYAESKDGLRWERKGLAVEDPSANHVNDPSVVKVGDTYFMYFTRAGTGVVDEIALATSPDGIKWTMRGSVISHGNEGAWDSLSVGRPSVLHEDGVFKLWYDGRKDLPLQCAGQIRGQIINLDSKHWLRHEPRRTSLGETQRQPCVRPRFWRGRREADRRAVRHGL